MVSELIDDDPPFRTLRSFMFQKSATLSPTIRFPNSESILRVAIFSCGTPNAAVSFLRLAGPARQLERKNLLQWQWSIPDNSQIDIEKLTNSDFFLFQREFCDRRICAPVLEAAREMGKPIVFELDDLLINVPVSHPDFKRYAAMTPDILAMLRDADFVTVTTEPLRRYLEEAEAQVIGKIRVLPNFVDFDIWGGAPAQAKLQEEPFVVGWFGSATHDEDLGIIKPAIAELSRKYAGKLVFKFWGYLPSELNNIPGVILVRGQQGNLVRHAREVSTSRIDLALAPLVDHPFNHAKSDLKWLEYSACRIPGIYSTVSPYVNSVEHGRTGWLVGNEPGLWIRAIERFMHDGCLRRSIATQAYDEVATKRNAQVGAESWAALYESFRLQRGQTENVVTAAARERAITHLRQYAREAAGRQGSWIVRKARKVRRWALKTRNRYRPQR